MTVAQDDGTGHPYMQAWQSRTSWQPATPPIVPHTGNGDRAHYVRAALDGEAQAVREAPQGQRNHQLNISALKLGRLVAGGYATEDQVRATLTEAARIAGLTPLETGRTISSGLRKGLASEPRNPDATASSNGNGSGPRDLTAVLGPAPGVAPDATPRLVVLEQPAVRDLSGYLVPGAEWLLDLPENPPAVWGKDGQTLWSEGEALMIAGGPGLGKTTLAGQLVRGRLGLQPQVLELPVAEGGRLLYLAMDRPQQIGRRLRQQLTTAELEAMVGTGRLVLGIGPPPQDLARHPELLPELCAAAGADTLVVDSVKDAAVGLTEDEVGAGYNRARQLAVTAGVQVLELHHLVKRGADGKAPTTLADVYGSAWLTAGAGSVLLLTGDAGDPIVHASHLKQPMETWGPADLAHDHARGVTTVHSRVDLLELLARTGVQTATSAARQLCDTEKPTKAEQQRARRKLEMLVAGGKAERRETASGDVQYVPVATARDLGDVL